MTKLVNEFRRMVEEMGAGETVLINAVNLSPALIEELRGAIYAGLLQPVEFEVRTYCSDVNAVMSGKTILPQMHYERVAFPLLPLYDEED